MNWILLAHQFRTVVHFRNQTELAQFVLEVARLADQLDHHPDLTVKHCSELSISIYSHDKQGITQRDYQLKEAIDELYMRRIIQ
jgi:4a-hydroxytetrahydrobiopterin dehydratase